MEFYYVYMVQFLKEFNFSQECELQTLQLADISLLFDCYQTLFLDLRLAFLFLLLVFELAVLRHEIVIDLQFLPQVWVHLFFLLAFVEVAEIGFAVWIHFRLWYFTDKFELFLRQDSTIALWIKVLRQVDSIK